MNRVLNCLACFLVLISVWAIPAQQVNAKSGETLTIIAVNSAPFYSQPELKKEFMLGTVPYGTSFKNVGGVKGWAVKLNNDGSKFYIPQNLVLTFTEINQTVLTPIGNIAYLLSVPNSKGVVRGVVPQGANISAFGVFGDWYYVIYSWGYGEKDYVSGFVSRTVVKAIPPLPTVPIIPVPPITSGAAIHSTIAGDFEGYEYEKVFVLDNGQVWQQIAFYTWFHYTYRPKVIIYKSGSQYKMHVVGIDKDVTVVRLK